MPRFIHDCDSCEFKGESEAYDIYYCPRCDGGTWIARYGNEGSQYASWPEFCLVNVSMQHWSEHPPLQAIAKYRGVGNARTD